MHQGRRRTTSVRAHRLSEEKAAPCQVYGRRSYGRYWEGPLEPRAPLAWYRGPKFSAAVEGALALPEA